MSDLTVDRIWTEQGEALKLSLIAGASGFQREIRVPKIQKPGLALTGYQEQLHKERVLTLGGTEIEYLNSASYEHCILGIETMMASKPACIILTRGLEPPEELVRQADQQNVPLFVSSLVSSDFIGQIRRYLQDQLSPKVQCHGVLMDVLGIGILIKGKSGIGKSEAALDLVGRGHRLVADDVVEARRVGPNIIFGKAVGIITHHMEIRGLGIINIKDLYGHSAVRTHKKIELVIELFDWDDDSEHERLGMDDLAFPLLGEELPFMRIPVRPGRNIGTIIEVAARNQLLKYQGHHSAKLFEKKLNEEMAKSMVTEA